MDLDKRISILRNKLLNLSKDLIIFENTGDEDNYEKTENDITKTQNKIDRLEGKK